MNSALRRLASTTDEVAGAARRGFSVLPFQLRETLENARRSGKYDEIHLNSVEAAWMDGDMSKRLRPANQGSESGSLILGEDHRTQTRQQYSTNAVNTAAKYKDVPIREGSVTVTDQAGLDWYKEGGEWDQELAKLLTFGRGPKAYTVTLEKLKELAKTNKNAQTKLDHYNSMLATGPMREAGDTLEYYPGVEKARATTAIQEILGDQKYEAPKHKSLEFHHKGMKAIESSIYTRARELVRNGDATIEDLVALNNVGYEMGIPTGSRKSAGLYMHMLSHQVMHQKIMLPTGIQPSGSKPARALRNTPKGFPKEAWEALKKVTPDITRWDIDWILKNAGKKTKGQYPDLAEAIRKWVDFRNTRLYKLVGPDSLSELDRLAQQASTMNMQELIAFQRQIFEDISIPMQQEAELMERVFEGYTPYEKIRATSSDLIKSRRETINRDYSLYENRKDRFERKGGVRPGEFDENLLEPLPAELSE